jgi:hypothetical protein
MNICTQLSQRKVKAYANYKNGAESNQLTNAGRGGGGVGVRITEYTGYRVPGFLFSRPNQLPPSTHPLASDAPPLVPRGGHTRLQERGDPNLDKGQKQWYSRYCIYVYTLCHRV